MNEAINEPVAVLPGVQIVGKGAEKKEIAWRIGSGKKARNKIMTHILLVQMWTDFYFSLGF